MRSYFARHTDKLLIRDEDLKKIWDDDRIAIHYPDKNSGREKEDSRSLDPAHYKGKQGRDRTAIARLVELARDGGYVWAESFVSEDRIAKIGYVEPGKIKLCDAQWDLRGQSGIADRWDGHPAVLKTVKLSRVQCVPRHEKVGLRAGRTRQGTISYWNVGERLADAVENRPSAQVWPNLSTAQQEAACAEFLRESHDGHPELPKLQRSLLPVGRTLQDIDLYGLADDGREIFGQVTFHSRDSSAAKKKLAVLVPYGESNAHLLFFCPGRGPNEQERVRFVSADQEVLPWIKGDENYATTLFEI
jgi:hypothetical protein